LRFDALGRKVAWQTEDDMAGRVQGKKVFITGGAQGLGAAMGRALASEGAKVALADINFVGAEKAASELNKDFGVNTAFAYELDVTDEGQWIATLEAASKAMGGISGLINNAGISAREGGIEELSLDTFRRVMSVNVDSVFLGAKHSIKYLAKNQPGSIVNISSIAGLIANHTSPAYNASKAAVWLLSKNIGLYCAKKQLNIRSNSIHPTFIDTPILDPIRGMFGKEEAEAKLGRQVPMGRIGKPEEIGATAVFLISDESSFITGAEIKVDGGISAM
jgi:NAD(P)-dependent dehydrogenase (short-subunit alcohol dehydrogenase family)